MNIQEARNTIAKNGNQFNDNTQDDTLRALVENNAYSAIIEYMIANNIKSNGEDWDNIFTEYEADGIINVTDPIRNLHSEATLRTKNSDFESIPIELISLFKTFDRTFHYPDNQSAYKTLYVDMDNVLVDFPSAFKHYDQNFLDKNEDKDEIEGIFAKMDPMPGAIESLEQLYKYYDIYLLSTAPYHNPSAWSDKLEWVQKYLPVVGYKSLILSHNKNLNSGEYLVDDRTRNGVLGFKGEHIHFGTEQYPDWESVTNYLMENFEMSEE